MACLPRMKNNLCPPPQGTVDEERGGPRNVGLLAIRPLHVVTSPRIFHSLSFLQCNLSLFFIW